MVGEKFILEAVNGIVFNGDSSPSLEFGENGQIRGQVCNRFWGNMDLGGELLKVSPVASTRMACPPGPLSELESMFRAMLEAGAELSREGSDLILKQGGHTLRYKAESSTVQAEDSPGQAGPDG